MISEVKGKKYQRISMVAGKCGEKIIAPMIYKGSANTNLFEAWVEQMLVPVLKPGQVVVMDNYVIHKSKRTKELIESVGCRIIFQPPYSPDLNKIEHFWNWIKNMVRKLLPQSENLEQALCDAFKRTK